MSEDFAQKVAGRGIVPKFPQSSRRTLLRMSSSGPPRLRQTLRPHPRRHTPACAEAHHLDHRRPHALEAGRLRCRRSWRHLRHFHEGVRADSECDITGLVTGHPSEKGTKYAEQYHLPQSSIYTYETYDKIRDNPAIEAVYIGLPNSMHCEYTIRAAEAGKHVLCEKPMAISSAECRKMIDACNAHKVKLMIAYRVHYDPTFAQIRKMIHNGDIGDIIGFQGGFYGQKKAGEWRLNRALAGGGSLLDLGIYPLNAIRWLCGEEPNDFRAMSRLWRNGPRFAEVEQTVEWVMKFPSGILANCGSSYGRTARRSCRSTPPRARSTSSPPSTTAMSSTPSAATRVTAMLPAGFRHRTVRPVHRRGRSLRRLHPRQQDPRYTWRRGPRRHARHRGHLQGSRNTDCLTESTLREVQQLKLSVISLHLLFALCRSATQSQQSPGGWPPHHTPPASASAGCVRATPQIGPFQRETLAARRRIA